jgi:hypothetical protein
VTEPNDVPQFVRWMAAIFVGLLGGALTGVLAGLAVFWIGRNETAALTVAAASAVAGCALLVRLVVRRLHGLEPVDEKKSPLLRWFNVTGRGLGALGAAIMIVQGVVKFGTVEGMWKLPVGILLLSTLSVVHTVGAKPSRRS